jgi:hypothetical protein
VIDPEVLARLARETGADLAALGLRASDGQWIARHAESIASLARPEPRRAARLAERLYRLARRAARTAR